MKCKSRGRREFHEAEVHHPLKLHHAVLLFSLDVSSVDAAATLLSFFQDTLQSYYSNQILAVSSEYQLWWELRETCTVTNTRENFCKRRNWKDLNCLCGRENQQRNMINMYKTTAIK